MKIKLPFILNDYVMSAGRRFGYINEISFDLDSDNKVSILRYSTNEVTRYGASEFKGFDTMSEADYKEVSFQPNLDFNSEVLYQNSSWGNIGILAKGKVTKISVHLFSHGKLFFYSVNNKGLGNNAIYKDKEDFIKRTSPKKELMEGQKYIFTDYSIDQNRLEPITIEKHSEVDFKIIDGYNRGEIIRGSMLYNSKESFYNKMFSQL